jgi:hypothetical protein
VATLVALPAEHASAGLMDRLADLVASGADAAAAGSSVSPAVHGAHLAWKWPAIIGGSLLAAGLASMAVLQSPKPTARPPVAPPSVVTPAAPAVRYYWDLNAPGLPPEFSVLKGKWSYQSGEGVNASGCLQSRSPLLVFLVNVPMDRLPVVVSYRTSPRTAGKNDLDFFSAKCGWSEYNSAAEFNGLAAKSNVSPGAWVTYREYVTESFIYRWRDSGPYELCAFERTPNARLVIGFTGAQVLIDDIRMDSIRAEDVPDASPYLKALAEIPASQRKGVIPLPQLKPGRAEVKQVTVRFDGHSSMLDWAKAPRN